MSDNEHIVHLQKAKRFLVHERRVTARKMVASSTEASSHASELLMLQQAIEAIDRAIEDEGRYLPPPRVVPITGTVK